ncbi:hypothetical protein M2322_004628 [Rhodoblastus acidophilus]|uniref:hypothetical protein n=1 Tax=Rhodoblastus acidophilus TaxID=1074 RepID=UPI002225AB88|nr:hypothetical protein [Rhodoblastus acidophilus]MCW2319059.1 hypothetical protein [Rhodoblastus acidophilus]
MSRVTILEKPSFEPERPEPLSFAPPPASAPAAERISLRSTGGRPRTFEGTLLCTSISFVAGNAFWYDISVYREVSGALVAAIKHYTRDEDGIDLFRVYDAADFEELTSVLENYEPAGDFDASTLGVDDPHISAGEVALRAAGLRLRIEEARRQYGDLVGEILYALETN